MTVCATTKFSLGKAAENAVCAMFFFHSWNGTRVSTQLTALVSTQNETKNSQIRQFRGTFWNEAESEDENEEINGEVERSRVCYR